jgi:hypothetical protein
MEHIRLAHPTVMPGIPPLEMYQVTPLPRAFSISNDNVITFSTKITKAAMGWITLLSKFASHLAFGMYDRAAHRVYASQSGLQNGRLVQRRRPATTLGDYGISRLLRVHG